MYSSLSLTHTHNMSYPSALTRLLVMTGDDTMPLMR